MKYYTLLHFRLDTRRKVLFIRLTHTEVSCKVYFRPVRSMEPFLSAKGDFLLIPLTAASRVAEHKGPPGTSFGLKVPDVILPEKAFGISRRLWQIEI